MPIADTAEFTGEEVRLALRNPGMPLEALRHAVTPVGMHYVLVHFDVPDIDEAAHDLVVDGLVERPLTLTMAELRARPAVTLPVVMECAGSGPAPLAPRPGAAPISRRVRCRRRGTTRRSAAPSGPGRRCAGCSRTPACATRPSRSSSPA